jgi:NodT family efflux transporter outer membrane factor (OMF) lipoprotein
MQSEYGARMRTEMERMTSDSADRRFRPAAAPVALAALAAALVAGCGANFRAPEYQRPDSPAKSAWSRADAGVSAAETIAPEWWRGFRDPTLDELVASAIAGNFDIRILAARTRVAYAQIAEAQAGALPILDLGAGASFEKSTGQKLTRQFNLGAIVTWEIDIWGKIEKGVQAQTAEFRATEADWRAGYLTLVAGVATSYFQILQFDEQIERTRQALDRNRRILAIYEAMFANGVAPQSQVLRQKAELNRLASDLLELRRLRALSENALATLVGTPAGELKVASGRLLGEVALPEVPVGLPAQLLARRPDVIAAEYRVLESVDLVGQARLAQLPSVSLTGRFGTSAFSVADLFKSFTVGFLPSVNFPLFDPGIQARIKTSEAQTQVASEVYRRTVIGAFEEVENALVNLDLHRQQRVELVQQVENLRAVAAQVEAQLKVGIASQLEVLETERSLLGAQLAVLANHQQVLSDTVALYKTLGGGWPAVIVRNEERRP